MLHYFFHRGTAKVLLCGVLTCVLAGCGQLDSKGLRNTLNMLNSSGAGEGGLNSDTIVAGLKEALRVGTRKTVQQTSSAGGYSDNYAIRITVPEQMNKMADALRTIGLGGQVDRFEARMNRAAETAASEAAAVFIEAVKNMSFADARNIWRGGDTAATEYFRQATKGELTEKYQPIVRKAMNKVGAVRMFEDLRRRYQKLPFAPEVNYQVEDYVVQEALDGLFTVLAKEEKQIRENPAARTTELLRRVFAQ